MTTEMTTQLVRIYNTLGLVSTKGEDTITMGQCLVALQEIIQKLQQDTSEVDDNG